MKRTLENCLLIKKMEQKYEGAPEQRNGKCLGYARSECDDEPCETCKACKLCESYDEQNAREKYRAEHGK